MLRILLGFTLLAASLASTSCGTAQGLGETLMSTADSLGRMIPQH
ncbi:MAG: hypothetical protein QM755_00695 [Luteolibacter sp.]